MGTATATYRTYRHIDKWREALEGFLDSQERNRHIQLPIGQAVLTIHFRKSRRFIRGRWYPALEVATATAHPPGTGAFTMLLSEIEEIAERHERIVYVETLVNERLVEFLCARGYLPEYSGICFSLYRELTAGTVE